MEDFLKRYDGLILLSYNDLIDNMLSKNKLREIIDYSRFHKLNIDKLYDMLEDLLNQ